MRFDYMLTIPYVEGRVGTFVSNNWLKLKKLEVGTFKNNY